MGWLGLLSPDHLSQDCDGNINKYRMYIAVNYCNWVYISVNYCLLYPSVLLIQYHFVNQTQSPHWLFPSPFNSRVSRMIMRSSRESCMLLSSASPWELNWIEILPLNSVVHWPPLFTCMLESPLDEAIGRRAVIARKRVVRARLRHDVRALLP